MCILCAFYYFGLVYLFVLLMEKILIGTWSSIQIDSELAPQEEKNYKIRILRMMVKFGGLFKIVLIGIIL